MLIADGRQMKKGAKPGAPEETPIITDWEKERDRERKKERTTTKLTYTKGKKMNKTTLTLMPGVTSMSHCRGLVTLSISGFI